MNKIKYLIILFLTLILFSGCSADAKIVVNYDGKTTESINVFSKNEDIVYGNKSIEDSIKLFLEKYKTALNVGKYKSEIHTGKSNSGALIYRDYDNICKMVKGTIFSQYLYDNITCDENKYYYEIKSVGQVIKNTDRYESWLAPENVNLKIILPVAAEEQNADEINGNTYIWKYNTETQSDKSFYLKISKNALKQHEEEYIKEQEEKNERKKVITISIITVIVIIIILISLILYRKYKKNKLDY